MTKKELIKAIANAPEDASIFFINDGQRLKISCANFVTREKESILSKDVVLLIPEIILN